MGHCNFPFALFKQIKQAETCILEQVGYDQLLFLIIVGDQTPSLARLFVVLTQVITHIQVSQLNRTTGFSLQSIISAQQNLCLSIAWLFSFPCVLASVSGLAGVGAIVTNTWGYELALLPSWSTNTLHIWHGPLSSGLKSTHSPGSSTKWCH